MMARDDSRDLLRMVPTTEVDDDVHEHDRFVLTIGDLARAGMPS